MRRGIDPAHAGLHRYRRALDGSAGAAANIPSRTRRYELFGELRQEAGQRGNVRARRRRKCAWRDARPSPARSIVRSHDIDSQKARIVGDKKKQREPALPADKHNLRFHDLRHTCASLLIAAGAHPKLIQARLGHASITTTLDRYGHLFPSVEAALADALDATFNGEGAPTPLRQVKSQTPSRA